MAEPDRGASARAGCFCQAVNNPPTATRIGPMTMHADIQSTEVARLNASPLLCPALTSLTPFSHGRVARALQTLCMVAVLTAFSGMFVHALTHKDAASTVSVRAFLDSPDRIPLRMS